jgi:hypothetical protein
VDELHAEAREHRRRGQNELGAHKLCAALHQIGSEERSYQRVCRLLVEELSERQLDAEALSVAWYLGDRELQDRLLAHADADSSARTWAGQAAFAWCHPSEVQKLHTAAARAFESSGALVHAAIEYERAQKPRVARTLWSRLGQTLDAGTGDFYAAGLAHFNAARSSRALDDRDQARAFTNLSVHLLEEAADRFEAAGQRERAFDCFNVLMEVGAFSGAFEHVLEGTVNAIRILSEDHLVYHAARLYQHGIDLAVRAGELSAAAALARELTAFARKNALASLVQSSLADQAKLFREFADSRRRSGAPPGIVDNALTQSLLAHAELGQYGSVRALFEKLSETEASEQQRQHYRRASERHYPESRSFTRPPDEIGEYMAPPAVWFDDLVEWQERGSAAACSASILLDPELADDRQACRAALVARLAVLTAARGDGDRSHADYVVCNCLGVVGLYRSLPALERFYQTGEPSVRRAAVEALGQHALKRSFVTLEKAIQDRDSEVRKAAIRQMNHLRFEHAFEPLARIYRQSDHAPARLAALGAIGHIDLDEAVDLLLEVMKHGNDKERRRAIQAATKSRSNRLLERAQSLGPGAPPRLREALRAVAQNRTK